MRVRSAFISFRFEPTVRTRPLTVLDIEKIQQGLPIHDDGDKFDSTRPDFTAKSKSEENFIQYLKSTREFADGFSRTYAPKKKKAPKNINNILSRRDDAVSEERSVKSTMYPDIEEKLCNLERRIEVCMEDIVRP